MKGYTTQFRALGTAEGDFHAEFTAANKKTRDCVRRLLQTHPHMTPVRLFESAFTADRKTLWATWKRSLPAHLRPIVLSVKERHHGPGLPEAGSSEYRTLLPIVKAAGGRTRRRLEDLVIAMPGDPAIEACRDAVRRSLSDLDAAIAAFERQG